MTVSGAHYPAAVPLRPVDTSGPFGCLEVIVYGSYDDGVPAAVQLSGTDAQHVLVTGQTGAGVTTLLRNLAIGGARIGCDVRICDPKRLGMAGLRGWPNVTAVATRVEDMIALIEDTYDEMQGRCEATAEDAARADDQRRILLIIDVYPMFAMLIRDHWHQARAGLGGEPPEEHPVLGKLLHLGVLARGAKMNMILASGPGGLQAFPLPLCDQFGGRIALGRQTEQSALLMFGDANAGRDIPLTARGVGTVAAPGGPKRVSIGWLPDPLDYPREPGPAGCGAGQARSLLLAMLPKGATWDGPASPAG